MRCSLKSKINPSWLVGVHRRHELGGVQGVWLILKHFPLSAAQVAPKNVFLYVPEVKRWLDSIGLLGDVDFFN